MHSQGRWCAVIRSWACLVLTITYLQVWRITKNASPSCIRTIRVFPPKANELAVTAVAVTNDLSQIAVGVEDGSVVLFQGDFNSVRGGISRDVLQRPSLAFDYATAARRIEAVESAVAGDMTKLEQLRERLAQSKQGRGAPGDRDEDDAKADPASLQEGAVTALAFHSKPDASVKGGNLVSLFVGTSQSLRCYRTAAPKHLMRSSGAELDAQGCKPGCAVSATLDDEQYMVLAQQAGIFFFSPEDRGVCYASDMEKSRLAWFRGYLLVASTEPTTKRCTVSVYDLKNKFVAFTLVPQGGASRGSDRSSSAPRRSRPGVLDILSEWGAIFVVTTNHVVYQLVEKDTATKLEHLFKIHLFDIAISLAYSNNYDDANIMDIYRMYGDYLHKKNDFDGAILQYTYTIGYVLWAALVDAACWCVTLWWFAGTLSQAM